MAKRRRKTITLKLTEAEAEGLMDAGNAGITDLLDNGSDEDYTAADGALNKLGRAMAEAWPEPAGKDKPSSTTAG